MAKAWLPCPLVCLVTIQIQGHAVTCCKKNSLTPVQAGYWVESTHGALVSSGKEGSGVFITCVHVYTHIHTCLSHSKQRASTSLRVSSL